jgi:uncharacterized protein (TIGR03437 family)
VRVNNILAPMFFSTPQQVGVQIPFEVAGQSTATVTVSVGGLTSATRTINIAPTSPGVFTVNQSGGGPGIIAHADGSLVSAENPARPNEIVVLFATGLGVVSPSLGTGAPSAGNQTAAATTVLVGGNSSATVEFSGASPGFVGLYQVNFRVPANTPAGASIPVSLTVGGRSANIVSMAVAQ